MNLTFIPAPDLLIPFALPAFLMFSFCYAVVFAAVMYHLKRYTLPDHPMPWNILALFIFFTALFWLSGVRALLLMKGML